MHLRRNQPRIGAAMVALTVTLILSGCEVAREMGQRVFGRTEVLEIDPTPPGATAGTPPPVRAPEVRPRRGLFGLAKPDPKPGSGVNGYLWAATLDVLHFLPVESADPFSGLIVTGWGRAPGATTAYRATVLIDSAALDATSLHLSLVTVSGAASAEAHAGLEQAIMTRARQLRIAALDR